MEGGVGGGGLMELHVMKTVCLLVIYYEAAVVLVTLEFQKNSKIANGGLWTVRI